MSNIISTAGGLEDLDEVDKYVLSHALLDEQPCTDHCVTEGRRAFQTGNITEALKWYELYANYSNHAIKEVHKLWLTNEILSKKWTEENTILFQKSLGRLTPNIDSSLYSSQTLPTQPSFGELSQVNYAPTLTRDNSVSTLTTNASTGSSPILQPEAEADTDILLTPSNLLAKSRALKGLAEYFNGNYYKYASAKEQPVHLDYYRSTIWSCNLCAAEIEKLHEQSVAPQRKRPLQEIYGHYTGIEPVLGCSSPGDNIKILRDFGEYFKSKAPQDPQHVLGSKFYDCADRIEVLQKALQQALPKENLQMITTPCPPAAITESQPPNKRFLSATKHMQTNGVRNPGEGYRKSTPVVPQSGNNVSSQYLGSFGR